MALGEKIGAFTIGHCLIWHQQVPIWVFEEEPGVVVEKADLITRIEKHIEVVTGR